MRQELEYDCSKCWRMKQCNEQGIANYCPRRDGELYRAIRGVSKNKVKSIAFWGQSNK